MTTRTLVQRVTDEAEIKKIHKIGFEVFGEAVSSEGIEGYNEVLGPWMRNEENHVTIAAYDGDTLDGFILHRRVTEMWAEFYANAAAHDGIFEYKEGSAVIEMLYVNPEKRKEGIGTELMQTALTQLKDVGVPQVWALAWKGFEGEAHYLNAKNGFETVAFMERESAGSWDTVEVLDFSYKP